MKLRDREKSEFEIQAEALALLRETLGDQYVIRGEYSYSGCRFDLAIFRAGNGELVCTLEIKKRGKERKYREQLDRYYRRTGKPCVLVTGKTLHNCVAALHRRLNDAGAYGL